MKQGIRIFEKEIEKIERNFDIFEVDVAKFCDKVIGRKSLSDAQKIDSMLRLDATLYMYLGSTSTKTLRDETRKKSRVIYRAIKRIDKALGDSFLSHQDKT